MAFPSYHVGIH